jgi:hypothetical protein
MNILIDKNNLQKHSNELHGYALNDNSIIFGTNGLNLFQKNNGDPSTLQEGRFLIKLKKSNHIEIKADVTGQELLFYYKNTDYWAISNSFYELAAIAFKQKNATINNTALDGFRLKQGYHIGEQLTSFDTCIKEIKLLPTTGTALINERDELEINIKPFSTVFNSTELTYEELITKHLNRATGLVNALASMPGGLNLFLSGGYDSRTVLGMLAKCSDLQSNKIRIFSHLNQPSDYVIAEQLASKFNFSLNPKIRTPKRTLSHTESLRIYEKSCLGAYLPIYPVTRWRPPHSPAFRVTGDLATAWEHFYGNGPFNGNWKKISADIINSKLTHSSGIVKSIEHAFQTIDVDPQSENAMEIYYTQFRTRFHCGRHSYKNLTSTYLATPMVSSELIKAELISGQKKWSRKKIHCDLLSALDPTLAILPFEKSTKSFDTDLITESKKSFSTIVPNNFQIYGSPDYGGTESTPLEETHYHSNDSDFLTEFKKRFDYLSRLPINSYTNSSEVDYGRYQIDNCTRISHDLRTTSLIYTIGGLVELAHLFS